jgi:hypothetical protein
MPPDWHILVCTEEMEVDTEDSRIEVAPSRGRGRKGRFSKACDPLKQIKVRGQRKKRTGAVSRPAVAAHVTHPCIEPEADRTSESGADSFLEPDVVSSTCTDGDDGLGWLDAIDTRHRTLDICFVPVTPASSEDLREFGIKRPF